MCGSAAKTSCAASSYSSSSSSSSSSRRRRRVREKEIGVNGGCHCQEGRDRARRVQLPTGEQSGSDRREWTVRSVLNGQSVLFYHNHSAPEGAGGRKMFVLYLLCGSFPYKRGMAHILSAGEQNRNKCPTSSKFNRNIVDCVFCADGQGLRVRSEIFASFMFNSFCRYALEV